MKLIFWIIKRVFLLLLLVIMTCCAKSTSKNETGLFSNGFILDFTYAIKNPQEDMKLSELADSITYIPLETTSQNLLGDMLRIDIQPKYIFYSNYCFDWSGKFIMEIGSVGQGACEDVYAKQAKILYHNGFFMQMGQK